MNYKVSFSLLFVLIAAQTLFGQTAEVRPYPMEEDALLWKISGKDLKEDSYLFGTMHLIQKEYFLFPNKLKKKATSADVMVMELEGLPNPAETLPYIMLKEGDFFDFFNEEQKDSILVWAKEEFNMEEAQFVANFSKMKPLAIVQIAVQKEFVGKTESYEMTLVSLAKENEIKIIGLETIGDQMAIFDNLSREEQTEMVMGSIRDTGESIETVKQMQALYVAQNVDELFEFIRREGGIIQEKQSDFLDQRNLKWIPKIQSIIANQRAFIAVGAGHLGGPMGLIRLLEKEGYTLTPIHL